MSFKPFYTAGRIANVTVTAEPAYSAYIGGIAYDGSDNVQLYYSEGSLPTGAVKNAGVSITPWGAICAHTTSGPTVGQTANGIVLTTLGEIIVDSTGALDLTQNGYPITANGKLAI